MELELELDNEATVTPESSLDGVAEQKPQPNDPVSFDRRRSQRQEAPRPGRLLAFQLQTDKLAKIVFATPLRGYLFVGIQLVCLLLIIWSMAYRYTGLSDTALLEYDAITLRTELDTLKAQWSDHELEQIESSLSQAEARVFEDFTSFAAWLKTKTDFASRLGMAMSYHIGQQHQTSLSGTISLPVHMSLKVQDKAADNTYVRALEYVRSLIDENRHLEVFGNEIKSDKDGIASIDLNIHVWIHDSGGNSDLEPDDSDNPEVTDAAFIQ